ncbi:hypothetical protein WR25_20256 isoform C [Diploscapter pachys]|uniref:Major facilitator superfamily (MFS) profile domain-containing protein n=2 Tax=Diploscapter pachys TaxID=2018661 RepID=A0A2A2LP25_9BILA|nr:hypothetical protein WR25_20256 isoform C [Diploscapter pachys]
MVRKLSVIDDFFELDKYQLVVLLYNEALIFTLLSNTVFNMYGVAQPKLLGCDDKIYNGTKHEVCQQYDNHETCKSPVLSYEFKSTVVEFEELCTRHNQTWIDSVMSVLRLHNKPTFSTTTQMVGIIIGAAIFGQLADSYGRKKVNLALMILMLFTSIGNSFVPSIDSYIIIRFFIGLWCGGLNVAGNIYVVENLPAGHRLWMSTLVTWAPNFLVFALFAWLTREWRALQRVCNIITACAAVICAVLMPESPKFLVQRRFREEAIKSLEYINKFKSKFNKATHHEISSIVDKAIEDTGSKSKKAKKYSFQHLYSSTTLALRCLVLSFAMFSVAYIAYALIFNLHFIAGSLYLNTVYSGLLRYAVGLSVAALDHFGGKKIGRKPLHFSIMSLICVCMVTTFLVFYLEMDEKFQSIIRILTLISFGLTGTLFLQILIVTAELFPTGIRNIASAHVNIVGRFGNLFGPMVFSIVMIFHHI